MKIVIAADIFPPDIGGPATYASQLAPELVSLGHEVVVLCYQDKKKYRAKKKILYQLRRINSRKPIIFKYIEYLVRLYIASFRADLIYAMGPVNAGLPALIVSKILGRKSLIVKIVGDYAWEQMWVNSRVGSPDRISIEEFQSVKKTGKIGIFQKIEQSVVKHADRTIVPCLYLKKIIKGWGANESKIRVIYNAFSPVGKRRLNKTTARELIGLDGELVLTVCRLTPWKGNKMLIHLWPELLKENKNFKLIVVGDGPRFDHLTGLVAEMKLENSIFFLGKMPREELILYYQAADMFVLNSAYEGLPHVILEALYFNLPIIASNAGGNSEIIENNFNGILLPLNDKEKWKKSILEVTNSSSLRKHLTSSRVFELQDFSFYNMMKQTVRNIEEVSQKKKK